MQRLAARDEHGQLRTGGDRLGDAASRLEQMLEVVEHEQQPLVPDSRRQGVLRTEGLGGGGLDEPRICERGERHPPDTVVVVVCGGSGPLQREPGLAASAGPGQRDQPDVGMPEQLGQLLELAGPADEPRRRRR